ncbi:MAG: hypothetical protein MUC31_05500, partial [Bacteroidales bacterium]|nr:hypothetical protein [Bacteroidales bacterium]
MKTKIYSISLLVMAGIVLAVTGYRCSGTRKTSASGQVETIVTNIDGRGIAIEVEFTRGKSHNHPLMAIWLEDMTGKYIETLYIAESIGKGIFQHGDKSQGQWQEGPVRRPAALPYWGHKRGIRAEDGYFIPTPENPMPDAVTGPTPAGDFILKGKSTSLVPSPFKILMEINQSWDWNEYWTNALYPDDENYRSSSQPAIVYEAVIEPESGRKEFTMVPVGYSHYSGLDGSLTKDLGTLTTALE